MKTATKEKVTREALEKEIETFRQLVIAARSSPQVESKARAAIERLNELHAAHSELFTDEDVRFLNVMRGFLGVRLEGHKPKSAHTKQRKRKGDTLEHCWRCETPIDERFTTMCEACSSKAYQWRVCPVCEACGCQRAGKTML